MAGRRNAAARVDHRAAVEGQQRRCQDVDCLGARRTRLIDGRRDLCRRADEKNRSLHAARTRCVSHYLQALGGGDGRVGQHRDAADAGRGLHEEILPLAVELEREQADARGVAARPRQRRNQSFRDHVVGRAEDRNRLRGRLCGARGMPTGRNDRIGRGLDHHRSRLGKLVVAQTKPAGNDRKVLPFDEAGRAQLVEECEVLRRLTRAAGQDAYAIGTARLLRVSAERPYDRCAAEEGDELSSSHGWSQAQDRENCGQNDITSYGTEMNL